MIYGDGDWYKGEWVDDLSNIKSLNRAWKRKICS
jgi:hypothetical protein